MPFALVHTFLAPRKPDFFPPLPGLPSYNSVPTAPAILEDLGLVDDIVFDEVFLDIMGLGDLDVPAPAPRASHFDPMNLPRNDSVVAPLPLAKRKASIANCLSSQHSSIDFENMQKVRQSRSKSVSAASASNGKGIRPADLLKPLPMLPTKDVPLFEWSSYSTASPTIGFSKYSMARKMSVPSKFLSIHLSTGVQIPLPPRSPKRFGNPSTV